MRPNAHLYTRPDAYRFLPPAPPRWATKDEVRLFWGGCAANRARPRRDADIT
jgi:hypothetical protein